MGEEKVDTKVLKRYKVGLFLVTILLVMSGFGNAVNIENENTISSETVDMENIIPKSDVIQNEKIISDIESLGGNFLIDQSKNTEAIQSDIEDIPKQYNDKDNQNKTENLNIEGGSYIKYKHGDEYYKKDSGWHHQGAHGMRDDSGGKNYIYYEFNIGTTNIVEGSLEIGVEFCSWSWWPWIGGPDLWIYNFASSDWELRKQSMGNQDQLTWKWYTRTNSNEYVSNYGQIRFSVYACEHDDVVVDDVGIKYETYIRTIYFYTNPITVGEIKFDGTTYTNNDYTSKEDGTYSVQGIPDSGYVFKEWTTTGDVSITSKYSASTTATVSGSGSIKAWFGFDYRNIKFYTSPTNKGSITFDGSKYYNGQSCSKADGTYGVKANPSTSYEFDYWSTSGGVSVANPDSATTTATVTGSGSIKAWFKVVTREIYFYTQPSTKGYIKFDGSNYYNGDSTDVSDGTYSLIAYPSDNYVFDKWTKTGSGISIANPNSQSTTVTVSGGGTITAWFKLPQGTIYFYTSPPDGGTIKFNGNSYSNGQHTTVSAGSYSIIAYPQSSYKFDHWSTTGSVSVGNEYSYSTTATVSGSGTVKAWFVLQQRTITFYTDPDNGGSITFSGSTFTNGQSTEEPDGSYQITGNPPTDYSFDKWTRTGGITIANPNSQMTTATISGDCTLKSWYSYDPANRPPDKPDNPNPSNGATNIDINTALKCAVSDPDGDSMDVSFYIDGEFVAMDSNVPNGDIASVSLVEILDFDTTYQWYTVASDGAKTTESDTWSFTTTSKPEMWVLFVSPSDFSESGIEIEGDTYLIGDGDRFNNDIWAQFRVLEAVYGIPRDHMRIYATQYENSTQRPTDINGDPTKSNCNAGLDWLIQKSGNDDIVWIMMSNHGGPNETNPGIFFSDGTNDEMMYPSELAEKIENINHDTLILLLEHCFSGVFIEDCADENHIIMTAAPDNLVSWAHEIDVDNDPFTDLEDNDGIYDFPNIDDHSWNPFMRHITEGLSGLADLESRGGNSDNAVSMKEMYNYAKARSRADTPWIDADGDGTPNEANDYAVADEFTLGRFNNILENLTFEVESDVDNKIFLPGEVSFNVTGINDGDDDLSNGNVSIRIFERFWNKSIMVYSEKHTIDIPAQDQIIIPISWESGYEGNFSTSIELSYGSKSLDGKSYKFRVGYDLNNPPDNPVISSPSWWLPDEEYKLELSSDDTEGNDIEYYIEWGDLTNTGWFGPFSSGEIVSINHTWHAETDYTVTAKSRDSYGAESEWTEFTISITQINPARSLVLGSFSDRIAIGDYIYFKAIDTVFYLNFPPGMSIKMLSPGDEIVISKDYFFGAIVEMEEDFLLIGIFKTLQLSDLNDNSKLKIFSQGD